MKIFGSLFLTSAGSDVNVNTSHMLSTHLQNRRFLCACVIRYKNGCNSYSYNYKVHKSRNTKIRNANGHVRTKTQPWRRRVEALNDNNSTRRWYVPSAGKVWGDLVQWLGRSR